MRFERNGCWLWSLLLVSGCAGTPLAAYNPMLREEWAEDEKAGPTIHTKIRELAEIKAAAPRLSAAEQEQYSEQLLRILRDERQTLVISQATLALAEFSTAASIEGLRLATEHRDSDVRIAACRAWQRKKSPEALHMLAETLGSDTELDVRIAAAHALQEFRDPAAISALGMALENTDPALQHRAMQSLKLISGRDLGTNVAAWKQVIDSRQLSPAEGESWASKVRNWF